jgi:hypothetical protein
VVLLPVPANAVGRGEDGNKVRVQLLNRGGDQPAQAGEVPFPFQVHQPVSSLVVRWREYLKEMVSYCLVAVLFFGEAAHALANWHFVAFPWFIFDQG